MTGGAGCRRRVMKVPILAVQYLVKGEYSVRGEYLIEGERG
jgi:hypothetical protein